MFEFISGKVAGRSATGIVIAAAGVGYDLLTPLGAEFPQVGEAAQVWTHLVVREDAHTLYGFARREDRELFRLLLRVRGVGPSMALGVLSGLSADDLMRAVVDEDAKAFTSVKGVGKKTAEQILLDLRDKSALLASLAGTAPASNGAAPREDAEDLSANVLDAISALVSIGYSDKEARKAVDRAAKSAGTEDLEVLVRTAMRG
ncbi:MAG: Holliday junction branch migration protein RuvA [Planctomycetota bacterium]